MTWKKLWAAIKKALFPAPVNPGDSSPPDNPPDAGAGEYVVALGKSADRTLKVPCSLSFTITGKASGRPDREEVAVWAVTAGADWQGGNPAPGVFSVRVNDYDASRIKLKSYGTDGVAREPKLNVNWLSAPSHRVTLAIREGAVQLTVDGVTTVIGLPTPPLVTICYGDPRTRKLAVGAKLTGIVWEGQA